MHKFVGIVGVSMALTEAEKKEIKFFGAVILISLILAFIVNYYQISLPSSGIVRGLSTFVTVVIEKTGYLGIFILMVLESAMIPIPSEVILPFSGYVAYLGYLNLYLIVTIGTIANLIGSLLGYYVGLYGGRGFVKRYGKYILLRESHISMAERLFNDYGEVIILSGRMLPAIRTVISFPAGVGKMDLKKFSIYTLIGSIPWNFALTYIGFILGEKWADIIGFFEKSDIIFVIAILIILVYYILMGSKIEK
ncbi:MAG: DedA family protein [Candidatus Njordarchaeia archaeon]